MWNKLYLFALYWYLHLHTVIYTTMTSRKWALTDEAILMKRVADGSRP